MPEFRVVLQTAKFAATCEFFGNTLAWPLTKEFPGGRMYGVGADARVEILEADSTVAPGVFLSIEVDNVEHTHATLVRRGAPITAPLAVQPWGHRNVSTVDPNGLTLVFFEVVA